MIPWWGNKPSASLTPCIRATLTSGSLTLAFSEINRQSSMSIPWVIHSKYHQLSTGATETIGLLPISKHIECHCISEYLSPTWGEPKKTSQQGKKNTLTPGLPLMQGWWLALLSWPAIQESFSSLSQFTPTGNRLSWKAMHFATESFSFSMNSGSEW